MVSKDIKGLTTMERRMNPRFDVQLSGVFTRENRVRHGRVADISAGGCKFQCDEQISAGSYIKFRILLPGCNLPLTVDLAVVRWCKGSAMGIEFIRMAPDQQSILQHFVKLLQERSEQSCGSALATV